MRQKSPAIEHEARQVVNYLLHDGRSIVSRAWVDQTICECPFLFPHLATMPEKVRLQTITYYLSLWFPLSNQTGQRPKAKTWFLNADGGIPCLA